MSKDKPTHERKNGDEAVKKILEEIEKNKPLPKLVRSKGVLHLNELFDKQR